MMDTKSKIKVVHALLAKAGLMHSKHDIVGGYGVESTTQMSDEQLADLIARLEDVLRMRKASDNETRIWRSNVLTLLNKCGVYLTNNDWSRVNRFLLDKRIAGKVLYEMNVVELQELGRKLRSMAKKIEQERENNLRYKTTLN